MSYGGFYGHGENPPQVPTAPSGHPLSFLRRNSEDDGWDYINASELLAALGFAEGEVTSVFGRAGDVLPEAGDYAGIYAPVDHDHTIEDVTGLQDALDAKSDIGHDHDGVYSPVGHDHDGVYSPVVHNHDSSYAPISHTHPESEITGLVADLAGKSDVGHDHDTDYAPISHTHTSSQVTDFDEAVDDRVSALLVEGTNVTLTYDDTNGTITIDADVSGGAEITIDDVTGLQAELDDKATVDHNHDGTYAVVGHNHDGAYSALGHNHDSAYSAIGHNHSGVYSPVSHNHDTSYAALSHTHTIDNVTGLQTALDAKAALSHTHTASQVTDLATAVAALLAARPTFYANKGGAGATTLTSASFVSVGFGTEVWDVGNHYNPVTGGWTPAAGRYMIIACVEVNTTAAVANELLAIRLRKNGADEHTVSYRRPGTTGSNISLKIMCVVEANGTDVFTIGVLKGGTGNGATTADAGDNYFQGFAI